MGWLGGAFGWVWDHTLGPVTGSVAGFASNQVMAGIVGWITDAMAWFVGRVLTLVEDTTKVNLQAGWFSGTNGPYRTLFGLGAVLLLGFLFLGLLQGLLAGDPTAMLLRMARDLPLAVLGMVVTIEVGDKLVQLSDALSHAVLHGSGGDAKQVLQTISTTGAFSGQTSFVVALLGLLCIIASLFVWVELVIRSALIYLLVALSPLVFAAMVWPATRGMLRKLVELGLALIFSKVVIAVAFSVGAAALAGVGDAGHANGGSTAGGVTASAGTLFSGLVIFTLAAFAPFVVLRLFPAVEAAVVAHGISRGPMRATQQISSNVAHIERLAGSRGTSSNGSAAAAAQHSTPDFATGTTNGSAAAAGPAAAAVAVGNAARQARTNAARHVERSVEASKAEEREGDAS